LGSLATRQSRVHGKGEEIACPNHGLTAPSPSDRLADSSTEALAIHQTGNPSDGVRRKTHLQPAANYIPEKPAKPNLR